MVNDSGVLDAGLSSVSYGLLTNTNISLPAIAARSGVNSDITSLTGLIAPAFSAYASSVTSLIQSAYTKIAFQTEEFDTNSCYDTANYRFTPSVAGYYQVNGGYGVSTTATSLILTLYKNGSPNKNLNYNYSAASSAAYGAASVYLNGTTDYIELYAYQIAATQNTTTGVESTYFQAVMVRAG